MLRWECLRSPAIHLTFADPNYNGIGDFSNLWSILMLVKHLLIVGDDCPGILV